MSALSRSVTFLGEAIGGVSFSIRPTASLQKPASAGTPCGGDCQRSMSATSWLVARAFRRAMGHDDLDPCINSCPACCGPGVTIQCGFPDRWKCAVPCPRALLGRRRRLANPFGLPPCAPLRLFAAPHLFFGDRLASASNSALAALIFPAASACRPPIGHLIATLLPCSRSSSASAASAALSQRPTSA